MNLTDYTNLFLNITILLVFLAFALCMKYFYFRPATTGPTNADIWIQQSVDDCNSIISQIQKTSSGVMLDKLENAIDVFENDYANKIPLSAVQEMVVKMYDLLAARKNLICQVNNS